MRACYVILHHTGVDDPHFDVMIESAPDGPLMTWRSGRWPIDAPTPLTRLPDHRRDYLTYEGPLSNDRGRVARVAAGTCAVTATSRFQQIVHFTDGGPFRPLSIVETTPPRCLAVPVSDSLSGAP
ncbi:MAG TPA: hypothetical protein VK324_06595 [Tepidisphaeraceae bacterium]|nr:hypothetical protein [Tepidisphaeraceae bacterium]